MAAIFAGFLWFCIRLWQNSRRSTGRQPAGHTNDGPANSGDANVHLEREVRMLLVNKRKIEAIRRVRELTGMGLKQAKDYVEALEVQPLR
jgi:ribosomal protein L7/L12